MLNPGDGILYMKIGTHAREDIDSIISRKQREIELAGYTLWGYGGNTCHPITMVQPFAKSLHQQGKSLELVMQEMDSHHYAEPLRAAEMSYNGVDWEAIPEEINALGSRFALCIDSLKKVDIKLNLEATQVAVGMSTGRSGKQYIKGRVDKACLEITEPQVESAEGIAINFTANVKAPYAVFLRS